MKIKKLFESVLSEDTDDQDLADVNPQKDSVSEIADALQDEVKDLSDNEKVMSNATAVQTAKEIKDTAAAVDAGKVAFVPTQEDFDSIVIKNRLTDVLDTQLANARKYMRRNIKAGANVLIEGLPGSGKTAIVESWCKQNGLVCVAVNATDPKLETAINGMPLRDMTKPDQNAVTIARSDLLKALLDPANEGKCVLFVDEFNRQRDQQLRRVFLSLFNEKRNADGSLNFTKTLLFSIVCINPAGAQYHDRGTDQLNQAERTRFKVDMPDFDSTGQAALDFFTGNMQKSLLKLGVVVPNSTPAIKHGFTGPWKALSKEDLEDIDDELKIYDLARFILDDINHPATEFSFDTRDDLADVNDYNRQLFNSRKLTDLIYGAWGDKNIFLNDVDKTSNLLDKDKKMLHDILDTYVLDLPTLRKEFAVTPLTAEEKAKAEADAKAANEVDQTNLDIEDDDDLFSGSSANGAKTAPLPGEVANDIASIISQWK